MASLGLPAYLSASSKSSALTDPALSRSQTWCRPLGGQAQIFFHGSEVQSPIAATDEQFDLQELLQLGDEVSYDIKHVSNKDKKINAINVSKLPKGTIAALQSAERGRYKGTVRTLPGESSWRSQAPYSEHAAASVFALCQARQLDTKHWLHKQGRMTRSETCYCNIHQSACCMSAGSY